MLQDPSRNEPEGTGTEPLSSGSERPPPPGQQGISIILYYRDGMTPVRLEPGQSVVVGRSEPADVRIPDGALSRQHARFSLRNGRVLVEDLRSSHGTWIADKRIERETEIELGGEVMMATVIARVLAFGMGWHAAVEGEAIFRRHLDEEAARAQHMRRHFAVLAVRRPGKETSGAVGGGWAEGLKAKLRRFDHVSLYTPDTALVLLPETEPKEAELVASTLASAPSKSGAPHLVGMAVYPGAASTVDELIQLAREAAGRATASQPLETAPMLAWAESTVAGYGESMIAGKAMRRVLDQAKQVASSIIRVILQGETGTGKEVLARFIHDHGPRRTKRMVRINCAAIPASLLESALFGHEKGSFTGASQLQRGMFEDADQGTLFLDEVGELSMDAQAALLRVLENGDLSRVGSTREVPVDVRVIAATHRDLEAMVREGKFRQDLLFRLKVMDLKIPPLRERLDEIEPLARRFREQANKVHGRSVQGISDDAMALLLAHSWPGNVRELRNTIERAVVMAPGKQIQPEDLPELVRAAGNEGAAAKATASRIAPLGEMNERKEPEEQQPIEDELQQVAVQRIEDALQKTGGNVTKAAKELGMARTTLQHRMRALGIELPKRRP